MNRVTHKVYIGKTNNLKRRIAAHTFAAKSGSLLPLHLAIRKYGSHNFKWRINLVTNTEEVDEIEKIIIASYKGESCYNIADGGEGGWLVPDHKKEAWLGALRRSRKGRTPALGMSHTEENKKYFSECGKRRWDMYGRYPVKDILDLSFADANKKYGISKTHYYRLRRDQIT